MDEEQRAAPQPDATYVIATLHEENRTLYDNKLYLIALLKQVQNEFVQAKALWDAEKKSLLPSTDHETVDPPP